MILRVRGRIAWICSAQFGRVSQSSGKPEAAKPYYSFRTLFGVVQDAKPNKVRRRDRHFLICVDPCFSVCHLGSKESEPHCSAHVTVRISAYPLFNAAL